MRICVVGGIFGQPPAYQARHPHAPETVLAAGLARLGLVVDTVGHDAFVPSDRWDVIHVHHLGRAAYLMAASRTRARFVFTGHEGAQLCGFERSRVRCEAHRFVLDQSDTAVALSSEEATALARLGHPWVEVVPNGVAPIFERAPLDRPRRGLLYVGQLLPLKGVDVLLRALATMRRHRDEPLTLAYHTSALEPELRALAAELGVAGRVHFAGPQGPEELVALYSGARALVLPSLAEALPSVISEALLAGTPVVASRVGGIPEQLGGHGTLVPPGNVASLAEALEAALDHPPDAERRQAMRAYAAGRFGAGAMAAGHAALYARVAAAPRRPRGLLGGALRPALRAAIAVYWGPPSAGERRRA
jgi:glycosyltransferase involved in cell wall biosynthesis